MVGIYRHIAKYIHLHSTRCSFMSWDYVQTYENAISPVCRFGFPVLCVSSFHDQHSCWGPLLCWWHLHMVCRCISLSLDSQVLLSVHWLARARVFGLKDYGIYGTKPGRNLRPMGLSRAQNWEAYALPLLLISHMFCPFLSIFEESEAETLTWHRPYSVNFTTSGHAINIPIYIHIIDIHMHRCVCVCVCVVCVCVCVNACACHGEKLHDILIYPVYPFKGPWSCPRIIGIGHAPE